MAKPAKRLALLDETTQRIRTYHPEQHEAFFAADKTLPSYRIYTTKYWNTAKTALQRIESEDYTSWYQVLRKRWAGHLDDEALYYRGNQIPGKVMFAKADQTARALKAAGAVQGDEIGCCITNTPELIYLMLGANRIGVKLNFFGAAYNPDYQKQILAGCSDKIFFATDDLYGEIQKIVEESGVRKIVLSSLADSLPDHPENCWGYEPDLDRYYHYEDRAAVYADGNSRVITFRDFLKEGDGYTETLDGDCGLDTEFLITYTSGSTKLGFPKQMIHKNRGLITDGVFHDEELCSNPAIPGFRTMAHIHTDTATDLISIISNALMQRWPLALEPEYGREIFLDYLYLNKPNYVCATTSFFLKAAGQYLIEKKYHDGKKGRPLDFLLVSFAVGEGCQPGEERFINQFLKAAKAGSGVKIKGPFHLPYTTLGAAGGDTEHGGIFYLLMKRMYEKQHALKLRGRPYGLDPLPYVQSAVLRKNDDGSYSEVGYNEPGIIVANSPLTMAGYKNFDKTREKVITDDRGIDWVSCDVFGYIDSAGSVHIKDRKDNAIWLEDGTSVLPYRIADVVEKDSANIMTCLVTSAQQNGATKLIINFDLSPLHRKEEGQILAAMVERVNRAFPELRGRILYRMFTPEKPFPVTASGKRNMVAVERLLDRQACAEEAILAR